MRGFGRLVCVSFVGAWTLGCGGDGAPADAGADSGAADASPSADASPGVDAGDSDAGPPPGTAPSLRWPMNGAYTGSPYVPDGAAVTDHPLRPKLMWSPVPGVSEFEVQMDDCETGTPEECSFSEPELDERVTAGPAPTGDALVFRPDERLPVSESAPVGRRYVWRVRACNAGGCGPWSAHRYLNVGRQSNDFNGDGFADVVIGGNDSSILLAETRSVFIYHGAASELPIDPSVSLSNPDDTQGGNFGVGLAAAGDVNGDGFGDLLVGAYTQDGSEPDVGAVFVYHGSADGISPRPNASLVNPSVGSRFGGVLAGAGDLDGDGFADIIVGSAFGRASGIREHAFVYRGSSDGIALLPDQTIFSPGEGELDRFGSALAGAFDANGDGFADLAIGAYGYDDSGGRVGAVFVYHGSRTGVRGEPSITLGNPDDVGSRIFARAVASAGDVNGDGFADIAVGAPSFSEPERVHVYFGGEGGFPAVPGATLSPPEDQVGARFGYAIAGPGDLDGDGFADLVVGASIYAAPEVSEGNAFVYFGSAGGVDATAVTLDNPLDQDDAQFGDRVARTGDTDGDGYSELLVGARFESTPELARLGGAHLYRGSEGGVPATPAVSVDSPIREEYVYFGSTLANAY